MAGNSARRGAKRTPGTKKGAVVGSGGQSRKALRPKGPTPRAEERTGHPAARRPAAAERSAARSAARADGTVARAGGPDGGGARRTTDSAAPRRAAADGAGARRTADSGAPRRTNDGGGSRRTADGRGARTAGETVAGRNQVLEALQAGVPARSLHLASRIDADDRVREVLKLANGIGLPLLEAPRPELDRLSGGAVHQGLVLQVPAYDYAHHEDLLARARESAEAPLLVALDGVTDPRNLGAVVRSVAAFGGHGVLVPERRAAGMTAAAWRVSAGAAARVPVARAPNLTRALEDWKRAGVFVVGLDADGPVDLGDLEVAVDPVALVIGSEGRGLSRLVREVCDLVVRIPITGAESLNAGVAAGVALYEVRRHRG